MSESWRDRSSTRRSRSLSKRWYSEVPGIFETRPRPLRQRPPTPDCKRGSVSRISTTTTLSRTRRTDPSRPKPTSKYWDSHRSSDTGTTSSTSPWNYPVGPPTHTRSHTTGPLRRTITRSNRPLPPPGDLTVISPHVPFGRKEGYHGLVDSCPGTRCLGNRP